MSEALAMLLYEVATVNALLLISTAYHLAKAMLFMCNTAAAYNSLLTSRRYTVYMSHACNCPTLHVVRSSLLYASTP
jgi:hypothetical protein